MKHVDQMVSFLCSSWLDEASIFENARILAFEMFDTPNVLHFSPLHALHASRGGCLESDKQFDSFF